MIEDSITDFRHVIEEKLKAKKDALDQTEQHLKKFSVLRDSSNAPARGAGGQVTNTTGPRGSIRGRLGPPPSSGPAAVSTRPSLVSRLGPKIQEKILEPDEDPFQETRSVLSRVVVEQQKSRDEALAEETQKMDKKEKQVMIFIEKLT